MHAGAAAARIAVAPWAAMAADTAPIGVIGGTGLYSFLDAAEEHVVETPWGEPSDALTVGDLSGRRVAFLPRHGRGHTIPPHRINARANLWALHSLGVERVVGPCAAGSLRLQHDRGDVVVCDQLVNLTSGRADTYFEGPDVAHLSAPEPYCEQLRPLAAQAAEQAGLRAHPQGTVAVVNGPRFGTRAESRMLLTLGADLVSMTQYPEAVLARELGMCYVTLALVTDHDSGLAERGDEAPVTQEEIVAVFGRSSTALREALRRLVAGIPEERTCGCAAAPAPLRHASA
jgi:5'-methylthioadenosine phosphorylase